MLEQEGIADVVERVRELELEVEAENVTKLLQSHDEASTDEEMWFLEMESTFGEDAVKIVEIIVKDLEHYIHLVAKAVAWFQRLTPILKEIILWVKCYQIVFHATEKFFHERKSQLMR